MSFALFLMLVPTIAAAHGLLVKLMPTDSAIRGTTYFTNGDVAAGAWIELLDLSTSGAAPVARTTDATGAFAFVGVPGHRYRLVAHGEEGHTTQLEFEFGQRAAPTLIDDAVASGVEFPAWGVLGLVLAASAVAAWWLRRGRRSPLAPPAAR